MLKGNSPIISKNFSTVSRLLCGELIFILIAYLSVVSGLYLAFQVFTTERVTLNFITFGPVTLFGLGVALPLLWTIKRGRTLADIGITRSYAAVSIALGLILSLFQYFFTLAKLTIPAIPELIPLITMTLTVGLFEAVFFRGWLQLRFEEAFGILPGIILGATFYAFYHVGYGMNLNEIAFLFLIGLIYAVIFRITKNVFILWPFLTPMGALYSNINEGLIIPFEATYGFAIVLALMIGSILLFKKVQGK